MNQKTRVTLGLSAAGALFGGTAAAAVFAGSILALSTHAVDRRLLLITFAFGAVQGMVLAPLAAWLLMRHVPLGLAFGGTFVGAIVGGVAGATAGNDVWIISGPVAGFALAAILLRLLVRAPRPAARPS